MTTLWERDKTKIIKMIENIEQSLDQIVDEISNLQKDMKEHNEELICEISNMVITLVYKEEEQ